MARGKKRLYIRLLCQGIKCLWVCMQGDDGSACCGDEIMAFMPADGCLVSGEGKVLVAVLARRRWPGVP